MSSYMEARSGSKSHIGTVLFSRKAVASCLKQSVYTLSKYPTELLSVKTLKCFKSSFAYEHNVCRNDESLYGLL